MINRDRSQAPAAMILPAGVPLLMVALLVVSMALASCLCVPAAAAPPDQPGGYTRQVGADQGSSGLIKPAIPPDSQEAADPNSVASANRPAGPGDQTPAAGPANLSQAAGWEDQKVKNAAFEMARSIPSVTKIQVCYALEDDEWWVILYDDLGSAIDVKQFVWNREQELLEPFLVINRIPRGSLDLHLTRRTPDRACQILDRPLSRP